MPAPAELLNIDPRRICLIKPSALGDVVQTLPLLPVLKERFPAAQLSWVVNRSLAGLLEGHPHLDEVIPFDRRGSWRNWIGFLRDLRKKQFDLVFDLQGLLRTGVMTALTGAAVRVGLESAREGAQLSCNGTIPDTGRMVPAHLRYWRVAEAVGMGHYQRQTDVHIDDESRDWAALQLESLRDSSNRRRPILAVHPGARWTTKRWPIESFAVVAAKAIRHYGFSVLILGSPDEHSPAMQLELLLARFVPSGQVVNLTGHTSLKQLAALLESSEVCLTNDSGPMHLAAGLGTSVVGIFTCTSPTRSGPPGDEHALVATKLSCAASYRKKCPYQGDRHMACLDELKVERVWSAFARLMDRKYPARRAA